MLNRGGFTLIELLVTIAIISIVASISTISFNSWIRKSTIEKQVREMFADISEARTSAYTQKKAYRMVFQPTSYVLKNYSSENEPRSAGRTVTSKTLKYELTSKNSSGTDLAVNISDYFVEFDSRGFASNNFSVIVNPLTANAALNCLVIFNTRANMGKMNGTSCEFK